MSSKILRSVQVRPEPLVIENAPSYEEEQPLEDEYAAVLPDIAEELKQEHPEAADEMIQDALQEAIGQLLQEDEADLQPYPAALEQEAAESYALENQAFLQAEQDEVTPDWEPQQEALITPPPAPTVTADEVLAQARQTAQQIVDAAQSEAAGVLKEADERAAEIERAAYDKGYNEGLTAGRQLADEQASRELAQVTSIVDQATELHDQMLRESESEMVALSLEIARKIIQAEVRTNPEVVTRVISAAVQKINGAPRVTIKVNPAEVDRVRAHWAGTFGPNYREKEWVIEGDDSVDPGGCVLQTRYGSLDAQIPSQFDEIQKAFALLLGAET